MVARRRLGNAARQPRALDFAQQSAAQANFALSATRAKAGSAGNTGEGALAPAYRKRRVTKAAMGAGTNFARRRRGALGQKILARDAAQRPAVSDRQYRSAALTMQAYQG